MKTYTFEACSIAANISLVKPLVISAVRPTQLYTYQFKISQPLGTSMFDWEWSKAAANNIPKYDISFTMILPSYEYSWANS
jgi:hypothetical protein